MSLALVLMLNLALTERVSAPAMSLDHLQADADAIYWLSCPGSARTCSLNRLPNGAKEPAVLTADVQPGGVYAVGDDGVYIASGGRISRIPKGGGKGVVLAKVEGWIKDIQLAGDFVYVSTVDTYGMTGRNPNPRHGTIVRFRKTGGSVEQIAETNSSIPLMAVDERRVYFVGDDSIQSVPIGGGRIETLARDYANPAMSIAADRDAVYVAAGGEVRRIPKSGGTASVLYKAQIILAVRVDNGFVYASRNLAYARGGVAETAAIVRVATSGGKAEVLADLSQSPQYLAVSRAGVFVVLSSLGDESHPDRIVSLQRP